MQVFHHPKIACSVSVVKIADSVADSFARYLEQSRGQQAAHGAGCYRDDDKSSAK